MTVKPEDQSRKQQAEGEDKEKGLAAIPPSM